jgi:hypothetical protein
MIGNLNIGKGINLLAGMQWTRLEVKPLTYFPTLCVGDACLGRGLP